MEVDEKAVLKKSNLNATIIPNDIIPNLGTFIVKWLLILGPGATSSQGGLPGGL